MDNDLDTMDTMVMNHNSDGIIDDDALSQQLKSSKPEQWDMDVPNEDGNENALGIDSLSNLNDSDTLNQPCRNSIQVYIDCFS